MKKVFLMIALTVLFPALAAAQGTAFNFQGRLNDGAYPANGNFKMQLKLYDSLSGGTQISEGVLRPNVTVINGIFFAGEQNKLPQIGQIILSGQFRIGAYNELSGDAPVQEITELIRRGDNLRFGNANQRYFAHLFDKTQ